jgi:hypothetical protein
MSNAPQIRIPAIYMRGGTSKGVFFKLSDLPLAAQSADKARDALLLRVIGSPDPYGKQTDGMGGAMAGEVASQFAVDCVLREYRDGRGPLVDEAALADALVDAVLQPAWREAAGAAR